MLHWLITVVNQNKLTWVIYSNTNRPGDHGFYPYRSQSRKPVGEEKKVSSYGKKNPLSELLFEAGFHPAENHLLKEGMSKQSIAQWNKNINIIQDKTSTHVTNVTPWCGIQGFHPWQRCDWKCPRRCEEWYPSGEGRAACPATGNCACNYMWDTATQ